MSLERFAFGSAAVTASVLVAIAWAKELHVDDTLFVRCGRQIAAHPLDPLGFDVNWFGESEPASRVMRNPPLVAAWLALWSALFGWSNAAVHAAMLVPALLFGWATLALARWAGAPRWTTLALACASPAFAVGSSNVMADVTCAAFATLGVVTWCGAIEASNAKRLGGAIAALCAAAMAKYVGLWITLPLAVWTCMHLRRFDVRVFALLLPGLLVAAYDVWHRRMYGFSAVGHAFDAASGGALDGARWIPRIATGAAFVGGAFVGVVVAFVGPGRSWRLAAACAACGVALTLAAGLAGIADSYPALGATDGLPFAIALQLALLGTLGSATVWMAVRESRGATARGVLFALWIGGAIAFTVFVDWDVTVRNLSIAIPAMAVLAARTTVDDGSAARVVRVLRKAALIAVTSVGLLLAAADRELASMLWKGAGHALDDAEKRGTAVWFTGHWGAQHLAEARGARALPRSRMDDAQGGALVVPMLNTNVISVPQSWVLIARPHEIELASPLVTLGSKSGAGFYAARLGPLPFAWNRHEISAVWTLFLR